MGAISDFTSVPPSTKAVLLFWAPWHEDSAPGGSLDAVLEALLESTPSTVVTFGRVHVEQATALTKQFHVKVVPTFVLINEHGQIVETVEGDNVAVLTQAVQRLVHSATTAGDAPTTGAPRPPTTATALLSPEQELSQRLDRLIRSNDVMLFMKGRPDTPRCGFSRQTVEILQQERIPFGAFDVLDDETVRQGLKTHSNWPTYPQLYVNGELIGGLDILKELQEQGSLRDQFGLVADQEKTARPSAHQSLDERLKQLVNQQPIMLFIKGLPSAPQCGFSRQIVEILEEENVAYGSFNILEDEDVRQGLKKYSNWPTYPQLYVKGELVGGLDIVKEMKDDGSLKEALHV